MNAAGKPISWFAYPKTSSKKYDWKINRDTDWAENPVRQVAIDPDWSALRSRRKDRVGK